MLRFRTQLQSPNSSPIYGPGRHPSLPLLSYPFLPPGFHFFVHLNQVFWILLYLILPKIVGKRMGGKHRNWVTVYNFSGILYFIKYITSHPWNCNIKEKLILHYCLQYKLISTFNLNFYCKPTPCQCIE